MVIHPLVSAKVSSLEGETLPVIIYSKKTIREIRGCILENYGAIKYELPFINAVAVEVVAKNIPRIASNRMIQLIDDDALVSKIQSEEETSCKVPYTKRERSTLLKLRPSAIPDNNVGVAVIDTGVAPHADLIRPYNRLIGFKDFVNNIALPYDDDGHGTHVAGIIAGNGYASGKHVGTAPACNIVAVKALDKDGNGKTSDLLASLQWVIDQKDTYNIRVVNLSLGIPDSSTGESNPLERGIYALAKSGLTVVVAAGNTGPDTKTINSPGTSRHAITVGAADTTNVSLGEVTVANFSSRGPTAEGIAKPDLVAPGVNIVSLDCKNPRGYVSQSGTSMAAPAVSGVAALLYMKKPELTAKQVKKLLLHTTIPLQKENRYAQGAGLLNTTYIKNALE